jgi:Domain of unknown function (DUF5911)
LAPPRRPGGTIWVGSDLNDLGQRFVTDDEMIVAWRWCAVLERTDLSGGAADADVPDPQQDVVWFGDLGNVQVDDVDRLRSREHCERFQLHLGRVGVVDIVSDSRCRVSVRPVRDPSTPSSDGSHSTVGGSPFPPIEDYGFISDCEVCALIAPSGNVEWMCLPRMDSSSVFAAVLDRDAGWFRVGPAEAFSHLALINAVMQLIRADEQLSRQRADS